MGSLSSIMLLLAKVVKTRDDLKKRLTFPFFKMTAPFNTVEIGKEDFPFKKSRSLK